MFKSNLNEISRGRYKSQEQKSAFENIKLLYKLQEAVIKLFKDYCSIVSEAKYKGVPRNRSPSMSAHVACSFVARVAKVSNCKVLDHSNLKMLSPK